MIDSKLDLIERALNLPSDDITDGQYDARLTKAESLLGIHSLVTPNLRYNYEARIAMIFRVIGKTEAELTGDVVSFDDYQSNAIDKCEVTMLPIQDLHGYDKAWVAGAGENVLDPNLKIETQTINDVTCSTTDGYVLDFTGTASGGSAIFRSNTLLAADAIQLPSGTYTMPSGWTAQIRRPSDGSYIGNQSGTFTASEDFYVYQIWYSVSNGATTGYTRFLALAKGSTAPTSWTPYENICPITGHDSATLYVSQTPSEDDATTYPVSFESSGSVYGGTSGWVTGKLVVTYESKLGSDLSWNYDSTYHLASSSSTNNIKKNGLTNFYCSDYTVVDKTATTMVSGEISGYSSSGGIKVRNDSWESKADAVADLATTQIVYELKTPVEYNLTPESLESFVGKNYFWSDAGNLTVELEKGIDV